MLFIMCLLTMIIYFTAEKKKLKGQVVSPSTPQKEADLYWGYNVRLASSLGAVFAECPYKSGYDLTIGTSERGSNIDTFTQYEDYL